MSENWQSSITFNLSKLSKAKFFKLYNNVTYYIISDEKLEEKISVRNYSHQYGVFQLRIVDASVRRFRRPQRKTTIFAG